MIGVSSRVDCAGIGIRIQREPGVMNLHTSVSDMLAARPKPGDGVTVPRVYACSPSESGVPAWLSTELCFKIILSLNLSSDVRDDRQE